MMARKCIVLFLFTLSINNCWGGNEIRVRILSKFHPQTVVVSSAEKKYTADMTLREILDLRHLNEFEIKLPEQNITRRYNGGVWLEVIDNELLLINWVDIESYVNQVVLGEMGMAPAAAMQSQAVLARSYAMSKLNPNKKYDISDLAYHQVYSGLSRFSNESRLRISASADQVMLFKDKIKQTVYHADCGSRIYNSYEIWGAGPIIGGISKELPHSLKGSKWNKTISYNVLNKVFGKKAGPFSMREKNEVLGVSTGVKWFPIDTFRLKINRAQGWNTLPSNEFTMEPVTDGLLFNGRGRGHLVGLCQQQAKILANQGWSYTDIIQFFYPNSELGRI